MAKAILEERDLNSSASQAAHVIDTVSAILESIDKGGFTEVSSRFKAPKPLQFDYKIEE